MKFIFIFSTVFLEYHSLPMVSLDQSLFAHGFHRISKMYHGFSGNFIFRVCPWFNWDIIKVCPLFPWYVISLSIVSLGYFQSLPNGFPRVLSEFANGFSGILSKFSSFSMVSLGYFQSLPMGSLGYYPSLPILSDLFKGLFKTIVCLWFPLETIHVCISTVSLWVNGFSANSCCRW